MSDLDIHRRPTALNGISADTEASGFNLVSEQRVGALLLRSVFVVASFISSAGTNTCPSFRCHRCNRC